MEFTRSLGEGSDALCRESLSAAPNFAVLMAARALLGVVIGGFWSLATATVMRLVPTEGVPTALGIIYMGNAVATALLRRLGVIWAGSSVGAVCSGRLYPSRLRT